MNTIGYVYSDKKHEIEHEIDVKIQEERIKDFCLQKGLNLLQIFTEPKNSTDDNRPALFKIFHEAEENKVKNMVILKLDVFGSDKVAKIWAIDELKKLKINLYSLVEEIVMNPDLDLDSHAKKAESIIKKVRDIPSLPEIVTKVMLLVQNPNSSAFQLANIIASDAGLTSRVLRLVNSAFYGFPKQISSIQHAIAILGFTTLRGLVLSSSIFKIFAPSHNEVKLLDYKRLWRHSVMTAVVAKSVCKYLHYANEEHIFSASILHDIGKIILDQYDHVNYILALSNSTFSKDLERSLLSEERFCGITHPEVGFALAEHWNLPDDISYSIKYHHEPESVPPDLAQTVNIVCLANVFARIIEENVTVEMNFFSPSSLTVLKLSESDISYLYCLIKENLAEVDDLENFLGN